MCCRFAINETVITWLKQFQPNVQLTSLGDISPTNHAPVLVAGHDGPLVTSMAWGFTRQDKQLVINARSETAWEKPLFREAMFRSRCVLPAAWFYEWDQQKRKNTFFAADGGILFLAGMFNEAERFVILTTAADTVMRPVHDRMPVCIQDAVTMDWLFDADKAQAILGQKGASLQRSKSMEQCSLFD
ncbi:MAG: SOS response-associated peptidase family protein [Bacteroidaceae bacterium]|nr:SOS response-associated peptidase family protein [Bacteroidaceae bacterium]